MLGIIQDPYHFKLEADDAISICNIVTPILLSEPTVLEIDPPINICGDIHGQLSDLISVFDKRNGGFRQDIKYLFLGDYVDRGPNSVEVICLLFIMKIMFPKNIYLLRGNHESPEMTEFFGFADECNYKLSMDTLPSFYNAFDALPISAIIGRKIFCVHGGLSPSLTKISQIREITRPIGIPEEGILADLLWSDPSKNVNEWGPNERGSTYTYGPKAVQTFLESNDMSMIIRGHQMAQNGVDYPFAPNKTVITVFTASHYAGVNNNSAGYVSVDEKNNVKAFVIVDEDEEKCDNKENQN